MPVETALMTPTASIETITELLVLQTPPAESFDNTLVPPTHIEDTPLIAATLGKAYTVLLLNTVPLHPPLETVYDTMIEPAPTPVINPVLSTVALTVLLVVQLPPGVALDN